jgi:hypothetical protein
MKGILANVGTMNVGSDQNLTGFFVLSTPEAILAEKSLPMYREVEIVEKAELDRLREIVAKAPGAVNAAVLYMSEECEDHNFDKLREEVEAFRRLCPYPPQIFPRKS